VGNSLRARVTAFLRLGEFGKARDALGSAERLGKAERHPTIGPWIRMTRAKLALRTGKIREADSLAASAANDPAASKLARSEALLVQAQTADRRKLSLPQVTRAFEQALKALDGEPPAVRVRAQRLYANALEGRGDLRAALEQNRSALDALRPLP
jgi:hypothetical protein